MNLKLRIYPAVAALLTLLATAIVVSVVHTGQRNQLHERLQVAGDRIEQRISNYILALKAIRGAFIANRSVPQRQYLVDLVNSLPERGGIGGTLGFGFAMATPADQPMLAEQKLRENYGLNRTIFPATTQQTRFPIVMIEPQSEQNARALGYDMYADATRREAMQNAARTGLPAATRPVELVQDGQISTAGFLIYVPIFANDGVMMAAGTSRDQVLGYIYTPIRINDMMDRLMAEDPPIQLAVEIYSDSVSDANRLHRSNAAIRDPSTFVITVADRRWILLVGEYDARARINPAIIVSLIGLILAGAIAAFVYEHMKTVEATENLAIETAAHAQQRELMLGEMQHRIKNSIARMLALFRLTAREEKDREQLVRVFDERLQAMARAQSLIVQGTAEARSLGDVVAEEMRQWSRTSDLTIEGPRVQLAPHQAQAIGLILHELSTNALKYGALASGQPVSIRWERQGAAPAEIVLSWQETIGSLATEPVKAGSGFGSRFMRMMVEGQLRGSYERELTETRYQMTIRFPEEKLS